MPAAFRELIDALHRESVAFAVIGGVALVSRGAARTTNDLDICYARDRENLERLWTRPCSGLA